MTKKKPAKGLKTRTENKNKRRNYLLECAGDIISQDGLDAFTIARLADCAGVTIPTVHNLLGRRSEILNKLVKYAMSDVMSAATDFDPANTLDALESFVDGLINLLSTNETFYRAAFMAGERLNFFEHQSESGLFMEARNQARLICAYAVSSGKLEGRIDTDQISIRLFSSQRLARLDWMHGYIDLKAYRKQVLTGMLITLCADASLDFKKELLSKIDDLK